MSSCRSISGRKTAKRADTWHSYFIALAIPAGSYVALALAEPRAWAHAHGVHGTPALVVYYRGQPLFRMMGRVTPTELLHRFQELHGKEV